MNNRVLPKGIYLRNGKFVAQARLNKKQIQLGTFSTLEDAVAALDKAIGRAINGLDSVKVQDKYIDRLKTYKEKTTPHEDDPKVIELFHLYIIVKRDTPYPAWQRNASLPAIVTLDLAKRFLAKRGINVVSMDDFDKLYRERLELLTEPWLKDYTIVGKGTRRNSLEVRCKGCGKLSLMRVGDPPVVCECGTADTVLYFGRGDDGIVYLSIGPTRPASVLGCLYVPRGGMVALPVGEGFESLLDPAPAAEADKVLEQPAIDKSLAFLNSEEDSETIKEEDVYAYNEFLENSGFDFDESFESDSDEVSQRLLAEDMEEAASSAASDGIKRGRK